MDTRRVWARIAAATMLLVGVGACGGSDDDETAAAAVAVTEYFEAFAEGRFRVMAGVSTGPALLYAQYRVAGERAADNAAPPTVPLDLELGEGRRVGADEIRFDGQAVLQLAGGQTRFGTFVVVEEDERWLVADYTRDGRPLRDFVASTAATPVTVDGVRLVNRLAFRDPSVGELAVPIEITNERSDAVTFGSYQATFDSASSGRQHTIEFSGPGAVSPGATADLVLVFDEVDDAGDGGELRVEFVTAEAADSVTFELDLPAFNSGPAPDSAGPSTERA